MVIFSFIFFITSFLVLSFLVGVVWRFVTKKPDFFHLEINGTINDLVQKLVNEIKDALALDQTELVHKFNPSEPPIDGEVAANVVFRVAEFMPCAIMLHHELNGDVKIILRKVD